MEPAGFCGVVDCAETPTGASVGLKVDSLSGLLLLFLAVAELCW